MPSESPAAARISIAYRLATLADVPQLERLIVASARGLQRDVYAADQIEGALGTVFGVDTQLIHDGTYWVALAGGPLVACGGWSRRRTLYGADAAKRGPDPLRDPRTEPAMMRAFFVAPEYARRGIGSELLRRSEAAAAAAGFTAAEMIATLAGEPLYAARGYVAVERFDVPLPNGARLPVVRMRRRDPLTVARG